MVQVYRWQSIRSHETGTAISEIYLQYIFYTCNIYMIFTLHTTYVGCSLGQCSVCSRVRVGIKLLLYGETLNGFLAPETHSDISVSLFSLSVIIYIIIIQCTFASSIILPHRDRRVGGETRIMSIVYDSNIYIIYAHGNKCLYTIAGNR